MDAMLTREYTFSKLLAYRFRNYLEGMRFMGFKITYSENRTFLENAFKVQASPDTIERIDDAVLRARVEYEFT